MPHLTHAGRRIAYRAAGAGPGVVLVHCSSSHSGQWKPLIETLAGRYRLAAPDLHGYGQSDPLPGDGAPYFVHDCAALAALVAETGAPVHLVGHSLGGTVALRLARDRPDLVKSLTLIEPVQFSALEEAGMPELLEYFEISAAVAGLVRLGARARAAERFVDFWVAPGAWAAMEPGARGYVEATIDRVCDDWAGILLDAPDQLRLDSLGAMALPCRLIRGGRSRASARAISALLADAIPGAALEEVPGAGHLAAALAPETVNPAIIRFIDAVERNG